jgi:hypothetical protein
VGTGMHGSMQKLRQRLTLQVCMGLPLRTRSLVCKPHKVVTSAEPHL